MKHNAPDNGQFQRRPRSQGQIFDTSRKILSQEMTTGMYNMEAFSILSLRSYDQCQFFFNWSNVKVKRLSTYKKISSQGIFM